MLPVIPPPPNGRCALGAGLALPACYEGASCHLGCWLASKVLADKGLMAVGEGGREAAQEVLKALETKAPVVEQQSGDREYL